MPVEYTGKVVDMRITQTSVEFFYQDVRIASHPRSYEEGGFVASRRRMPEQMADRPACDQVPFDDRFGMPVDAENDRRLATKLANLIEGAKLRFPDAGSESVIRDPKRGQ